MMTKNIFYLLILIGFVCCKNESNPQGSLQNGAISKKEITKIITTNAKVISIEERLIMPSDYLTKAMTVITERGDTLVFLDMSGFEKLIDQQITLKYKWRLGDKLLLCFDCTSYTKKIDLYDMTAHHTDVEYKQLQLTKYTQDEWITPNSIFEMADKNEKIEQYNSNDNDMIKDSIKMKNAFFKYGITTKVFPELQNRKELDSIVQ